MPQREGSELKPDRGQRLRVSKLKDLFRQTPGIVEAEAGADDQAEAAGVEFLKL